MPPGFRRMLTPAMSLATGSSRVVTSRAQPPLRTRFRAAANGNLRFGTVPESVHGGVSRLGFSISSGTFRGPRTDAPRSPTIGSGAAPVGPAVGLARLRGGDRSPRGRAAVLREPVGAAPRA